MPIHYILRGKQQAQDFEHEGMLSEEQLSGVDIRQDTALINVAIRTLRSQGIEAEWQECVLESAERPAQTYIRYKKRWTLQKVR
ncbi:hypothetical protein [Dictyobacter kobayashii]|uniref:Uncharacterized protein n=1 Tax=Dictyobacter kobayashii TaxID=2014872 RepID=A0A402AGD7_9CHLR|nr:hypothetical protein [Dictyobacter kobayashii]GCE18162.1 hypothetical protein KDK_19620 [Dictyobacter kobayashii]